MNVEINPTNRDHYLNLLLLADEQIDMLKKYMYQGDLFVFSEDTIIGVCIVFTNNSNTCELKNIAINPLKQHLGYGKKCIQYIFNYYQQKYAYITVGTGANTSTVGFYERCGFIKSHCIKNFFIDNYDHYIYENNIQLKDMQYLKRSL